ncbi:nuclear transport factor 2 family protein [Luteimonas sp. Y-2-2-4F]|nr:nuclear transport factor 2 family protein [Luteimonas sp. Y-2-2-4F]MCD9032740.1 nuclear transport factor 2 family protein [Luteimonas sp. Y-2-2-4F]
MDTSVRQLFERYERFFNRSLGGDADMAEAAAFYAPEFIAAWPGGVSAGKNDERLGAVLAQGYERYRAMGTRAMRLGAIRVSPIDDLHCVAHVAWTATYARDDRPETTIDFEVHYLVQSLDGQPRIFGWVTGDEEALLKERGIVS